MRLDLKNFAIREADWETDKSVLLELRKQVFIVDYPRYFTPNGDGYHDTWNIPALSVQLGSRILIFDRYGKLLKQISPAGDGWDGTYNGQKMPTTDYWFLLEYNDLTTGEPKQLRAHFSLKR